MRTTLTPELVDEVAEYYDALVKVDPSNPPSCRAIAGRFGFSASTAHKIRENLWAARRLRYPPRRQGSVT